MMLETTPSSPSSTSGTTTSGYGSNNNRSSSRRSNGASSSTTYDFPHRPRILLTGLRRSGKTSIQQVIFNKMSPTQTHTIESTRHLETNNYTCGSFINFQVQEIPGQLLSFRSDQEGYDIEHLVGHADAVVYVIDAMDDYGSAIQMLTELIHIGRKINMKIRYEVFIHKSDGLNEDNKLETQRDIHNQVVARLDVPTEAAQDFLIFFHLTSIFDHSIFEAFSKVIQKLLPQHNALERLLNHLLSTSGVDSAFLFDVQTKISIATDSQPTDMQMYELCTEMIDLLLRMSDIYGQPNGSTAGGEEDEDGDHGTSTFEGLDDDVTSEGWPSQNGTEEGEGEETPPHQIHEYDSTDNVPVMVNGQHEYDTTGTSYPSSSLGTTPSSSVRNGGTGEDYYLQQQQQSAFTVQTTNSEPASSVFDSMSSSVIKLTGGRALYLKEINRHLALICVLREEALTRVALIDYNVRQLKRSIIQIFRLNLNRMRQTSSSQEATASHNV